MPLPTPANTTCAIYRTGNAPPNPPDVAGVACFVRGAWWQGQEYGDRNVATLNWTHVMYVDVSVDIRDAYAGEETINSQNDLVYIPDQHGIPFRVVAIERKGRGTATDHKIVYLDRQAPPWPVSLI